GTVGVKGGDGGVLAAGDRHDIAGDIGVVGGFGKAAGKQPPAGIGQPGDDDDRAEHQKALAAARGTLAANIGAIAHGVASCLTRGSKPPPTASSRVTRWTAAWAISAAICWRAESRVASAVSMGICPDRPRR